MSVISRNGKERLLWAESQLCDLYDQTEESNDYTRAGRSKAEVAGVRTAAAAAAAACEAAKGEGTQEKEKERVDYFDSVAVNA